MNNGANRAVFEHYVRAFNANDIDGWMALLMDDFRLKGMGMPESGIDHDIDKNTLRDNMLKYKGLFKKTITLSINSIICEGDLLAAECQSTAILNDGTPYANRYCFHVSFRDGLISEMREYCCTFTAHGRLRQSGVGIGIEA